MTFRQFQSWRNHHISDNTYLVAIALLTGVVTGIGAHILKLCIRSISTPLTSMMNIARANWILLLIPVLGILLTGILQRYILHRKLYHGVDRMQRAIAERQYRFPLILTVAPIIASSITLGFGGSAGSEGPIAYTGSAIGSNFGRLFRLPPNSMPIIIACGASAGIAGIFKSPVGGAFFSLEVLAMQLSLVGVIAVFVASLSAALTAFSLSGFTTDLSFANIAPLHTSLFPWLILLGLFCGFYSLYYSAIVSRLGAFYGRMRNPWLKNLLSGSVLALLLFIFPALFGEGYNFMGKVLAGSAADVTHYSLFASDTSTLSIILIFGGILLVKAFACASSNSGGGVAGDFAPTLFAGCIAGFFFAATLNHFFQLNLPPADFAYFGMAAVMAGAIRAPLMAIFITVEMTQTYQLLLPVVIVATISYLLVRLIHRRPFRHPL